MLTRLVLLFSVIIFTAFSDLQKNKFVVCAIFQNEAQYLKEWIEYHRLQGFDEFYLYDNSSTDNYFAVLQPYIEKKIVHLFHCPNQKYEMNHCLAQLRAHEDCLKRNQKNAKWIAFIDIDEFLLPNRHETFKKFLNSFDHRKDIGCVCVNWQLFGTSHIKKLQLGDLVIEKFILKSNKNFVFEKFIACTTIKSIVRPEACENIWNHHADLKEGFIFYPLGPDSTTFWSKINRPVDLTDAQINHYWTRDEDFFLSVKIPRREAVIKKIPELRRIFCERIEELNAEEDREIHRFLPELKNRIVNGI